MIGRRSLLRALGVAPLAARAAAEKAAASLAAVQMGVGEAHSGLPSAAPQSAGGYAVFKRSSILELALRTQADRDEIESLYYRAAYVAALDPDLAGKRSWSLAAKITFQRQRNVKRMMEQEMDRSPWDLLRGWFAAKEKWL